MEGFPMKLTSYEQEMLNGRYGEGKKFAMEIIAQMGKLYGADHLLPITKAHIDTAAYTTICDAGADFVKYFADQGIKVSVPTTVNSLAHDRHNWKELGCDEHTVSKSEEIIKSYQKMGVIQTWTCAPYQTANIPRFGEVVSWSESNAVNYINSVIGARAERLPDMLDICCAVTGRVPAYGLYLTENRKGDVLFRLEGFSNDRFHNTADFSLLGYYIGQNVGTKVPVIEGLPTETTGDQLKLLSAALAAGGSVALFHCIGLTPEAATLEDAFHGSTDYEEKMVTPEDLRSVGQTLGNAKNHHADIVMVGCPHASVNEMLEIANLLNGRKTDKSVRFWLMTSEDQYHLADETDIMERLLKAGVIVTRDTCAMLTITGNEWRGKTLVTNSAKGAMYASDVLGVQVHIGSTEECVEAAVNGKW
jgi:predicted aconitase